MRRVGLLRRGIVGHFACAVALVVSQSPVNSAIAEGIFNSPFDRSATSTVITGSMLGACVDVPDPVTNLPKHSRYKVDDPTKSIVDPERAKIYDAAIKDLRKFQKTTVDLVANYVKDKARTQDLSCGIARINHWARNGALLIEPNDPAQFNRAQFVAGIALTYIQLQTVEISAPDVRPAIESWLRQHSEAIRAYYSDRLLPQPNNHALFAALAVAASGVATRDKALLDWGMSVYTAGVCTATPEGALPREMARGKLSRGYQLYATGVLAMLAEIGARNDVDTYGMCDGAIHRVIGFTLTSLDDPAAIERITLVPQDGLKPQSRDGYRFAWLVPYLQRFRDDKRIAWLDAKGELFSTGFGGDFRQLYDFHPGKGVAQ